MFFGELNDRIHLEHTVTDRCNKSLDASGSGNCSRIPLNYSIPIERLFYNNMNAVMKSMSLSKSNSIIALSTVL